MATNHKATGEAGRTFLPAAGHDWFLPLYDPFVKALGGDRARNRLLDQAVLRPGQRVLDIGCGTGTLAILIKRLHPDLEVVGLDPDAKALARAQRKRDREAVEIEFDQGFADALPYSEASFDRVFSSFMFHHLEANDKLKTLCEVRRVLKPGGSLHLLDFAASDSSARGVLARWLHSSHRLRDNSANQILALMRQAELAGAAAVGRGTMLFGHFAYVYYRASAA